MLYPAPWLLLPLRICQMTPMQKRRAIQASFARYSTAKNSRDSQVGNTESLQLHTTDLKSTLPLSFSV